MPQIIVTADRGAAFGEGAVTLRERVSVADFESEHFATQLAERLGWAVEDADHAEQVPNLGGRRQAVGDRRRDDSDYEAEESSERPAEATEVPAPA
jgi:hypothetical protein